MSQQVLQVFPHVPIASILEDLRQTHSAELTIDNILQERLNLANVSVITEIRHYSVHIFSFPKIKNNPAFDSDSDESEESSDNNDDSDLSNNQ